jgi:hypothetical protein
MTLVEWGKVRNRREIYNRNIVPGLGTLIWYDGRMICSVVGVLTEAGNLSGNISGEKGHRSDHQKELIELFTSIASSSSRSRMSGMVR